MKSIFTNCRIIGSNVRTADYLGFQSVERGNPRFVVSRSDLMSILECPHKWIQGAIDDSTKATEWGSLIDCLLLTPERFESDFCVQPDTYERDGEKKAWRNDLRIPEVKAWHDKNKGKQHVSALDSANALLAAQTIRATWLPSGIYIGEIIEASDKQVFVVGDYFDRATGLTIQVKALLDVVPCSNPVGVRGLEETQHEMKISRFEKSICDLKTGQSCNPSLWPNSVFKFNYDAQAWMQMELYNEASGEERTDFFNIVQESEPPYEVSNPLPLYSSEMLACGESKIRSALQLYCRCLKSGKWPSYGWNIPSAQRNGDFYFVSPNQWQIDQTANLTTEYRTELPALKPIETELRTLN